jgi:hypothetical protein
MNLHRALKQFYKLQSWLVLHHYKNQTHFGSTTIVKIIEVGGHCTSTVLAVNSVCFTEVLVLY